MHGSLSFPLTAVRPDFSVTESDAAVGEVAIVIEENGQRVCRIEVAQHRYSVELVARVVGHLQAQAGPCIKLLEP